MNRDYTFEWVLKTIEKQMVEIPDGKIILKDYRIKKRWTVEIKPFLIGKFPVTQEIYFAITQKSPSGFKGDLMPVESISWKEAIRFCNVLSEGSGLEVCYYWLNDNEETYFNSLANGYRLLTEAEWEYACKAGTKGIRYGELEKIAWYKENSRKTTHEVGLKEPNPWGLYDMLGNVWEWCSDLYDENTYGSYRIFKGGGWYDDERGCIASNRRRSHPTQFKIDDLGFRLARNLL